MSATFRTTPTKRREAAKRLRDALDRPFIPSGLKEDGRFALSMREDLDDALRLLVKAVKALPEDDPTRLEILTALQSQKEAA